MATARSSTVSVARKTVDMPPAPRRRSSAVAAGDLARRGHQSAARRGLGAAAVPPLPSGSVPPLSVAVSWGCVSRSGVVSRRAWSRWGWSRAAWSRAAPSRGAWSRWAWSRSRSGAMSWHPSSVSCWRLAKLSGARRAAGRPRPRAGRRSLLEMAGNESSWMSSQAPELSVLLGVVVAALDLVQALVELGHRGARAASRPRVVARGAAAGRGQQRGRARRQRRCRRGSVIAPSRAVRPGRWADRPPRWRRRPRHRILHPAPLRGPLLHV